MWLPGLTREAPRDGEEGELGTLGRAGLVEAAAGPLANCRGDTGGWEDNQSLLKKR